MKTGFTLIELLVVVLIIGILSAAALPQYENAVKKSRVSTLMPLLAAIASAEEVYFLANGAYTPLMSSLDIDFPGGVTPIDGPADDGYVSFPDGTVVDINAGFVIGRTRDNIRLTYYFLQMGNTRFCSGSAYVCKSLGGTAAGEDLFQLP